MVLAQDRKMFPVDTRLDDPVDRLQEVIAVRLHMKADKICSQQPVHQLPLPGTDAEGFRVWPRDMPEDRDARVRPLLFDQPRQQREVIILDQNHWTRRVFDFLQHRVRELAIDLLIKLPVGRTEDGAGMGDMAEWPKTFVGKTVIVTFLFPLAQPNAP